MKIKLNYNHILLLVVFAVFCFLTSLEFVVLFSLLLILPGYIITDFFLEDLNFAKKLILGTGAGISFASLFVYLLSFTGLPLNKLSISLAVLFLSSSFVFKEREKLKNFIKEFDISFEREYSLEYLLLTLILILALFTRIYPVMNMNAPVFADSAADGTIAKLIMMNQGVPETWEPFLNIELRRQPGFSSLIAWIGFFSNISIPRIILLFTNTIHAFFPISVFLFAYSLFENKLQSIISGLIALVAAFPTYLFQWGVTGSVVAYFLVPISLYLLVRAWRESKHSKFFFLLALIAAGGILIHPYLIFFLVLFSICSIFIFFRKIRTPSKKIVLSAIAVLLIPLLITLPYITNSIGSQTGRAVEEWKIQANSINPSRTLNPYLIIEPIFFLFNNPVGDLFYPLTQVSLTEIFLGYPFGVLFTLVFIYSLYLIIKKKNKIGFVLLGFYALFLFFGPLQAALRIKFPFWSLLYPSRAKYFMALPLSLILSYGFTQNQKIDLEKVSTSKIKKMLPALAVLIIFLPFGLFLITNRLNDISELKGISDKVMENIIWIEENLEDEEVVLNLIDDVEAGAFVGGPGQWIPSLTGNRVIFPATAMTENYTKIKERTKFMELIKKDKINSKEFTSLLRKYNISYVFTSRNTHYLAIEALPDREFKLGNKSNKATYWKSVKNSCERFEEVNKFQTINKSSDSCLFRVVEEAPG